MGLSSVEKTFDSSTIDTNAIYKNKEFKWSEFNLNLIKYYIRFTFIEKL